MTEPRTRSLLDFAIAASVAVVPIMLGMLLLVGVVRPFETAPVQRRLLDDRYISVRHVAALKTFEASIVRREPSAGALPGAAEVLAGVPACRREWSGRESARERLMRIAGDASRTESPAERIAAQLAAFDAALQRFSTRPNAPVSHPLRLDTARWFAAASRTLEEVLETPDYPGQRFKVRCGDLVAALGALSRGDARMLDGLAWRGTAGDSRVARWRPEQETEITARQVMRRNPWDGLAGCIYLGRRVGDGEAERAPTHFIAGARTVQRRLCGLPEMAGAVRVPSASDTSAIPISSAAPALSAAPTAPTAPTASIAPTASALSGTSAAPAASAAAAAVSIAARAADAARDLASVRRPLALSGEPGPADPVDDTRWMVPPSLSAMLQPLESLRQPSGSLYRLYTDADAPLVAAAALPLRGYRPGVNRVRIDGAPADVGFSVDLTIDPALQALAQKTAACYTGRHDVCRALGMQRREDQDRPLGHLLLEGAMVRMAAVAIIDVASGRIEALAGALSPCARQDVEGPVRGAACDRRLPHPGRFRVDAALNPAVFHDAMPASTIKPIMAAAFLSDPANGARWLAAERAAMTHGGMPSRDSLRGQLMRSDSARFLDRMFCIEKGFLQCRRPWDVQAAAQRFGWNAGCAEARIGCGKRDLLFGRELEADDAGFDRSMRPLSTPVLFGRLMSGPLDGRLGAPMQLTPPAVLDAGVLRRCAAGADGRRLSDDDWGRCRGGAVVDIVAEGWGQGHARASPLGVAGMMAVLAAAANGQAELHRPHLVESLHGVGRTDAARLDAALSRGASAGIESNPLARDAAEVILSGLSYSHRAGTARTACEQVFDARRCNDIAWLAGKTGTPSFPNDGVSLDELTQSCRHVGSGGRRNRAATCSALRPYKWYVAAYRRDRAGSGPWTQAIAVLTERNWLKGSGQVHGVGDHGPNPAAEIAMQIAGRDVGAIEGSAP